MLDILKSIDISKNSNCEQIYNLFKTSSCNINKKIQLKIKNFNSPLELIEYYSKSDVRDVMHIFDSLEKSLNNICDFEIITNFFSSNIDQYMSFLSKIILVTFLISKFQIKINDILTSTKNNLIKLNSENKIETNSKELINDFINNLINDKKRMNYSRRSTQDGTNCQTPKNFTPKNFSIKNNITSFVDSFKTAKFNELEKINESQNSLNNNNNKNDYNKESQFTLSKFIDSPVKRSSKFFKSSILNENEKYTKKMIPKTPDKKEIHFRGETKILKKNNSDRIKNTNMFFNLLETVNSMYKSCFINADEKVKLKIMIMAKSIEIEKLYLKFHDKKNVFMKELKKVLE